MAMAVTKFRFPTVAHVMAHRKMHGVKMGVVASPVAINNAATIAAVKAVVAMKVAAQIIAVVKTVAVRLASVTNVADLRLPAANLEPTANAPAITAQSQQALVGIRMP